MKTKQQKEIIDAIINEVTMWSESEEDFRTLDITGRIEKALKGLATRQVSGIMPVRSYRDKIFSDYGFKY